MTSDKDEMKKAADRHIRAMAQPGGAVVRLRKDIDKDLFQSGWRACLDGPAVTKLVSALEEIATEDFRGNRPHSAIVAFKALVEFQKLRGGKCELRSLEPQNLDRSLAESILGCSLAAARIYSSHCVDTV